MTKRITAELTVAYTPLPPDKIYSYMEGIRILAELLIKANQASQPVGPQSPQDDMIINGSVELHQDDET
jgi:hypothetical protein